ncbi:phage head-tail joining protein [Limobrevibacterium gyesilva]|uniref:Uncharacterized protein n=1 Tax=Limobrevibacterium gyesilva TaxID=2991712 RepID=A0AA41YRF8_9PROT|nr:hypothetical protein [Limobrevibacterium gyesilva]MCW3477356.1 hypothetical protein [Limobrevibacterium gyesilva]
MAFTAADLDTIEQAIATGALKCKFADGREVFYQTTTELLRARDAISQVLAGQAAAPPSRMTRVIHNRGDFSQGRAR